MKNETATHSKRYYLFNHIAGSVEDTVQYRDHDGEWTIDFDHARLWPDYDALFLMSTHIKPSLPGKTLVIGEVDVAVNGMFPLVVV